MGVEVQIYSSKEYGDGVIQLYLVPIMHLGERRDRLVTKQTPKQAALSLIERGVTR